MFGQIISILAGAFWLASLRFSAAQFPICRSVADGFTSGIMSCVYWATAFTIAEKIAGSRAAIASGLMVTIVLNAPGNLTLIPLAAVWISYAVIRSRSARVEGT
jgi:hypothetical protein